MSSNRQTLQYHQKLQYVGFKVEFTSGCSCMGCWKKLLKVVNSDGVLNKYPFREVGKLVLGVTDDFDPQKLVAELKTLHQVKTIELWNQKDSTNSQVELNNELKIMGGGETSKSGGRKGGGGLLGWLSRRICKQIMGCTANANKIKPVLVRSRTERWGGSNNGVVIGDDDENESEHVGGHEINRAPLRRSRSERQGGGDDRDVQRMRHIGRVGKTEQTEQTERMHKMSQELEESDEEPEVSLVHRSRTKRQCGNDASVIADDGKKGKRDKDREISHRTSRSRTKRRGGDDGVLIGDDGNKGKHVEEHGVNQVLSRSRSKRRVGNNGTVTDDDGNQGKHDRKHEIDVVNHRKDNKISNDRRERKKSSGGGNARHIHQMTTQKGQTEQTWQTATGREPMEKMDSMWQVFEDQDQQSSNWSHVY